MSIACGLTLATIVEISIDSIVGVVLELGSLQLRVCILDVATASHYEWLIGKGQSMIDERIDDVGQDKNIADSPGRVLP